MRFFGGGMLFERAMLAGQIAVRRGERVVQPRDLGARRAEIRVERGADILELLPQAGARRALGLEVVAGLLELAPQRLGVGLERRRLFALFLQRLLELLVLLTRAGEGGAFVVQRLSRLLDFELQSPHRLALAGERGRGLFELESCALDVRFEHGHRARSPVSVRSRSSA